jgi:acetylglutamate kinase
MAGAGLQARFVLGQRYTDQATLRIAERVLCADINGAIVRALSAAGVPACGLTSLGACVLRASRTHATDKEGHPVDLGLVGRVEHVQADVLAGLCARGVVPVLAPVALDADPDAPSGAGKLNVNADLAAGEVARAIRPSAFILVSDTPGIRTVPSDPTTSARLLSGADVARLEQTGAIDGGMLPKVEACNMALDAGVERVAITDGRPALGLLRAALTDDFPGTTLVL